MMPADVYFLMLFLLRRRRYGIVGDVYNRLFYRVAVKHFTIFQIRLNLLILFSCINSFDLS